MANKYLDYNGLAYFWEKIKAQFMTKVDKVDGKGLSSNDYTSNEKTKLAGIAAGAQVNVLEGIQKNGTTVTITNKIANISIPVKTSDLTNDSGFITTADIPQGSAASTTIPLMDGTAATGSELAFARGDHVHPTDTTRAPLASPALTGTPTAPTATAGTNTTQIATTAFVTSAIQTAQTGAATFQGTAPTTFAPTNYKTGYYWVVGTAGTYAGEACEPGDMIFAVADYDSAYQAADFNVIQTNLDITSITNAEIDTIMAA